VKATIAREAMLNDIRLALKREDKTAFPDRRRDIHATGRSDEQATEIKNRCEQKREELINQFEFELTRIRGVFHRAATPEAAFQFVEQLISDQKAKTMVAFDTPLFEGMDMRKRLKERGVGIVIDSDSDFLRLAAVADLGLSGADYALSETGTLVLVARKGQARAISLLPPVHIAVLKAERLLSNLNDLFPLLRSDIEAGDGEPASAITFITGPSRTADIELTLVVGVHGPQKLHVILVD